MKRVIVDFLAEELKKEQAARERKARIKTLLKKLTPEQPVVVDLLTTFGD
jgi:hypothetical protein